MRLCWLLVCATGCFYNADSPLPADFATCPVTAEAPGVAQPTWFRDVQPVVTAKCMGCHTDSGIAPFALTSYQDFVPVREAVRQAVEDRVMPPWQPNDCCNHYRWDRSLSDAERATLLGWLDQNMPLGDPADEQAMPPSPPGL